LSFAKPNDNLKYHLGCLTTSFLSLQVCVVVTGENVQSFSFRCVSLTFDAAVLREVESSGPGGQKQIGAISMYRLIASSVSLFSPESICMHYLDDTVQFWANSYYYTSHDLFTIKSIMTLEGNNFDCLLAVSPSCVQCHYVMLYLYAQIE